MPSPGGTNGITGVILAGGEGRRMHGASTADSSVQGMDKALRLLAGRPLIAHVIARIAPQVDELLISSQPPGEAYIAFGYRLAIDAPTREVDGTRIGPLAGMLAGLYSAKTPMVLFAPCDTPFLPADIAARLHKAISDRSADVAVASVAGRANPVVAMVRREQRVITCLSRYISNGGRRATDWYTQLAFAMVDFGDEAEAFANINTEEDLFRHERQMQADSHIASRRSTSS